MDLRDWLVIHRIIDLSRPAALQSGDDACHKIIAMNHIYDPVTLASDARLASEILEEKVSTFRSIDAGHTQNDRRKLHSLHRFEQQLFRLHQQLAGWTRRLGWTGFLHHG